MAINFGLAETDTPNSYLGPLQALALGQKAKVDQLTSERQQRTLQARDQALQAFKAGDVDKAYNTAFAGGDFETAEKLRQIQARHAAGDVVGLYGSRGPMPGQGAVPIAPPAAPAPAASPAAGLISAQPRMIDLGNGPVPLGTPTQPAAGGYDWNGNGGATGAPAAAPVSPLVDHTHPETMAVGQAISHGQIDPTTAWSHLYQLDPEMGDKMMGAVKNMDGLRLARLGESNDAIASAAQTLKSMPMEQRAAAAQHMLPGLAAHGVTPDMVGDLSDAALAGYIGQAVGVKGMIEQADKDRTYSLDVRKQAEVERHGLREDNLGDRKQGWEERKPTSVADGSSLVTPGGSVVYGDGAAPTDPAGIAAQIGKVEGTGKNPLSSAVGLGQMLNGTFVDTFKKTFPQRASGMSNSQILALRGTGLEGQMLNTITQNNMQTLVSAGLPATAGNTYTMHFLGEGDGMKVLRASPDTPVSSLVSSAAVKANPFLKTMTVGDLQQWAAKKMNDSSGASKTEDAGVKDHTLTMLATVWLKTGTMPTGLGRKGVTQRAVVDRADEISSAGGTTPDEMVANWASNKADKAGLDSLQKRASTVLAAEHAAQANGQLALSLGQQNGNGNIPIFNAWANAGRKNTGDPVISKFNAAIETFANEYATVMGKGQPTDTLRNHAHDMINTSQSPRQLAGVIQTLQKDMANVRTGFESERQATLARISGGGRSAPAGGSHPADIAAILQKYSR